MEPLIAALTLAIVGYIFGSVKVIYQGNEALVERFGQYKRTLKPGLNFVIPVIDTVIEESTREQLLDIDPQTAITSDNVTLQVDAIMYWKILDIQKAYYAVEDLDDALKNLVLTTLRSEIGKLSLEQTISKRNEINQALLRQLDDATETWGVKVIRVEVQEITLSEALREALEKERAAQSTKQAAITEAEGMVQSIELVQRAIQSKQNPETVLRYLIAQRYIEGNVKLSESKNAKVIFMDPGTLTEAVSDLLNPEEPGAGAPDDGDL